MVTTKGVKARCLSRNVGHGRRNSQVPYRTRRLISQAPEFQRHDQCTHASTKGTARSSFIGHALAIHSDSRPQQQSQQLDKEIEGRRAREAAWLMQAGRKVICQLTHSTPSIMSMHDAGYPPKMASRSQHFKRQAG
ncbi:hypothetical protein WJX82_008869 [Trebouxia sp. C0006]